MRVKLKLLIYYGGLSIYKIFIDTHLIYHEIEI